MIPAYSPFQAYDPEIQYSPGSFLHQYVPEKHVSKEAEIQHEHIIDISPRQSQAGKAFGTQLAG